MTLYFQVTQKGPEWPKIAKVTQRGQKLLRPVQKKNKQTEASHCSFAAVPQCLE